MPQTSAERQARRRARQQAGGLTRIQPWVEAETAAILQRLTRERGRTQADVLREALAAEARLTTEATQKGSEK